MLYSIKENALRAFCHLRIESEVKEEEFQHETDENVQYHDNESAQKKQETVRRSAPKVGRNDPCPCGSGKKYKKCCGR
jgi:preprotein translocase subunit SecA